jgi:hypothetical protein
MKPSGIEPATFLLVEQCLNKMCHCVPISPHKKAQFSRDKMRVLDDTVPLM